MNTSFSLTFCFVVLWRCGTSGILAGELKHGPLALVDKAMPVVMIATRDPVYVKCINALQQVQARDGRPILVCEKGDEETKKYSSQIIEVPHTVDCLQVALFCPFAFLCFPRLV